jgi:hypothetical protein
MPDELIEMAERCERAEPSEQRALLTQAFEVVHGRQLAAGWETEDGRCETNARLKFDRMLEAGAFESAAMTLVPEGWAVERSGWHTIAEPHHAGFELWQYRKNADGEYRHSSSETITKGSAVTAALALCAAALRARATTEPTP